MTRRGLLSMMIALMSPPALAQDPPTGFHIPLGTPAATEPPTGEAPDGGQAEPRERPRAVRRAPVGEDVATPIGRQRGVGKALQRALKRARDARPKRSARRARRFTARPTLGPQDRARRWGEVETVTPLAAAHQRVRLRGDEVELPDRVLFHHDAITFTPGSSGVLGEAGDLLQATPEIELVLIEGHTDATGAADYNQQLSEARASAVRAALVEHGVAPERLVAYGFGETRPAASNQGSAGRQRNRRVVLRLIEADRQALDAREPAEWGLAEVIAAQGEVLAITPEGDETRPRQGDHLSEGTFLRVEAGMITLRLPDLSVMTLQPDTQVTLSKLYADREGQTHYAGIKLISGQLRGQSNPRSLEDSRTLVALPGGSLELSSARWVAQTSAEGIGWIRLDRGEAQAALGGDRSLALSAGRWAPLGAEAPEVTEVIGGVTPKAPLDGPMEGSGLSWEVAHEEGEVEVEIATDVDFHRVVHRERVSGSQLSLEPVELPVATPLYWRATPIFTGGVYGRPSSIHRFTVGAPGAQKARSAVATGP